MKILVTFHTTHNVLTLEKYTKKDKITGRIVPVPRKYSASCGLAWMGPIETKQNIKAILEKYSIAFDNLYEID